MKSKSLYLYVFMLMTSMITNCAMVPTDIKQFARIRPFCKGHNLCIIKNVINHIEKNKCTYPDYAQRKDIIWSDFTVKVAHPSVIEECKDTIKQTKVAEKLLTHNPESLFEYEEVKKVLCSEILPIVFEYITQHKWASLPEEVFGQFFLQRCNASDPMNWHQDPGEDYDAIADFSLVLLMSSQSDPEHGWSGGEFKIRPGRPAECYEEKDVTTLIQQFNEGILFNNKDNSHSVTKILASGTQAQRDLIVVTIYKNSQPKAIS